MTHISPLLDFAMLYLNQASFGFSDIKAKQEIMNAFHLFFNNLCDKNEVAKLLIKYIGTTQPLDRIVAILNTPDTPLPVQANSSQRKKTKPWSNIEDTRLLAAIHKFGTDNWVTIAKFVGNGRTRAQCAQRWYRSLDPKISKNEWSPEEEAKLIHLIKVCQNKPWSFIAAYMGNRSDVQCRYHFLQMQKDGQIKEDLSYLVNDKPSCPLVDLGNTPQPPGCCPPPMPPVPPNQLVTSISVPVLNQPVLQGVNIPKQNFSSAASPEPPVEANPVADKADAYDTENNAFLDAFAKEFDQNFSWDEEFGDVF
ncbi:Myb-like DNA-binding domain containing protein [Histomonas meleagridis]|uniref:Myb-like DNA-binding domain containing protein n=1 Tax=Histomonas meleagridis TaxID=135588 RepID=UPI00355A804F|nr:Myb-like DNA-binding domain containing protein [Histomonas meleagridis]KAH0805535.1 Myb-like DNA-binding domain containing protein [Histomonas meleagridis]